MNAHLQTVAAEVHAKLSGACAHGPDGPKSFSRVAAEVSESLGGRVAQMPHGQEPGRDSEWQRVNSYIADVLKDAHVLYSKLARLQGDFIGAELRELEKISEDVLDIGEQLSHFMKAFHSGEASMLREKTFGTPPGGAPAGTPPPAIPPEFERRPESDFETELDLEGTEDFVEFEEEEGGKEEE